MGSSYFTDFKLFHKELHLEKMISIEAEEKLERRVHFNKPFKCIDIKMGKSTKLLAEEIEWHQNIIDFLWMDYDEELDPTYFTDIEIIFSNVAVGSVYLMSCNKQLKNYQSIEAFREKFGDLVPIDITIDDLAGDRDFLTIRKMVLNKINEVINGRNLTLSEEEKIIFRQLFFFTYRDGAPMISFGGFIDKVNNAFDLKNYNLHIYDFIASDENRYIIDPPALSYREALLLNSLLPEEQVPFSATPSIDFIPLSDRNKYRKLYKYLPTYMDVRY